MKKLSLLMALILLVTVGGVYATWNYAQDPAETAQGFALPKMETVVTSGDKGSIVVDTSNFSIKIDDDANDNAVHKATLVMSGYISIKFTEAVGADEDVKTNGIKLTATVSCTENWQYDSKDIFILDTANSANVFSSAGATKELKITADEMNQILSINDFTLATYAEFQEFQTILNRGNIKIVASEAN